LFLVQAHCRFTLNFIEGGGAITREGTRAFLQGCMDVLLPVAAKLGTPTFGAKSERESLRAASADVDRPLGVPDFCLRELVVTLRRVPDRLRTAQAMEKSE
jgi:hypothetical protein